VSDGNGFQLSLKAVNFLIPQLSIDLGLNHQVVVVNGDIMDMAQLMSRTIPEYLDLLTTV
jgi:hypothetical protein